MKKHVAGLVLIFWFQVGTASAASSFTTSVELRALGEAWQQVSTSSTNLSQDPHATAKAATYMGYVEGVGEAEAGVGWCPSASLTIRDIGKIVLDGLQTEAKENKPAILSVKRILAEKFPCQGDRAADIR